ncbi:MAG: hypothetical protein HY459_03205 [Parcubacteria group bacterium]|nr:hypothetical protein [Parcubacteria group bacterium]
MNQPLLRDHTVWCDYCRKPILSQSDFIAVAQFYPKFPYAKYHAACYANFLKSGKLWIGPRGPVILTGRQSRRSAVLLVLFSLLMVGILVFAVRPALPRTIFTNVIFYFLLIVGILLPVEYVILMLRVKRIEEHMQRNGNPRTENLQRPGQKDSTDTPQVGSQE